MKNDLTMKRFGRLVALRPFSIVKKGRRRTFWSCVCDCGNRHNVVRDALVRGDVHSCGCLQKSLARARRTSHGKSKTRIYKIWLGIIDRCENPNNPAYHNYGGRGISLHQAWRGSFEEFAEYVGRPPSRKHSIDRINNDRGYVPGNVRWATSKIQGRNRRGLHIVRWLGRDMCLTEAAEIAGLSVDLVRQRIKRHGWSLSDALTIPPKVGQKINQRKIGGGWVHRDEE